jgi:hypothetical protein
MDYGLSADLAADLPRFGSYAYDENWNIEQPTNWLDERVSKKVVNILRNRGLFFNLVYPLLGQGCVVKFYLNGDITSG